MTGGTWNNDGIILIGQGSGPIHKVSAAGGEPKPLLKLNAARKKVRQTSPHFLPDGRHFLFLSIAESAPGVYLGSLDSEETRLVLNGGSNVSVVAPGLLLFGRGPALMAQPFDLKNLQVNGAAFSVADQVSYFPFQTQTQVSMYSSSRNGVLVYRSGKSSVFQVSSYDRSGKRIARFGEPRLYEEFALSPDEKWLAVQVLDPKAQISDIWRLNLASGILSRVTSDAGNKDTVVWSPDGREILFSARKGGRVNLYRKSVGGAEAQSVQTSMEPASPAQWLKDGSFVYQTNNGKSFYRRQAWFAAGNAV
jgi:Tol biopolymer transport system component